MTQSLHPKTNSCQFYPHIIRYYQDVPILHPTLPFFSPGYNWWQLLKSSRISTAAAIFKGSISPTEKLSQTGRTSQNGLSILYYHIYYQKKIHMDLLIWVIYGMDLWTAGWICEKTPVAPWFAPWIFMACCACLCDARLEFFHMENCKFTFCERSCLVQASGSDGGPGEKQVTAVPKKKAIG